MNIIYNFGIYFYVVLLKFASLFNAKARLWVKGRRNLFRRLNQVFPVSQRVIWIHCASLGEFEQGRPLIEKIKAEKPDYFVLLTFFSPSGYEIRKNYPLADYVCYLPADTPNNATKFIETVKPNLVYFVKYEFWRNYLHFLHKKNIPVYLISAIFRENQIFFRWYGSFFKTLLHYFRHIYVQDQNSGELLQKKGITEVSVSGDTRFDRVYQIKNAAKTIPEIEKFKGQNSILIAGSSWEPDEEMIIRYYKENQGKIKLIIAPHEVHSFNISRIKNAFGKNCTLFSEMNIQEIENKDVILVDTIGHLSSLYQYGDIGFIGGGFGKGLHNTLEAATFGLQIGRASCRERVCHRV